MDRRHAAAMILGLVLCLALLGRWAMRPDEPSRASADPEAIIEQPTPIGASPVEPAGSAAAVSNAGPDITADQDVSDSGIFRGRIVNAVTRQPVREFDLEFHPARRTRDSPQPRLHSFKAKEGRFEYRGLPAGVWTIFATARGYQRFELADVAIATDQATQEMLIPMRPGYALHGRVFDENTGDGIAGAHIDFREAHVGRFEGNFRARPSTRSLQDGKFVLDGLPAGPVIVSAYAENFGVRDLDAMAGENMAPVEIGLSAGGTVAGYLAGADGLTPVTGFISLNNLDESSGSTIPTGSAGEFKFTRASPGRYRLSGRSGGLRGDREFTLARNEQLEGIVLATRGGHSIRGIISGLKPEQLRSTHVLLYREGDSLSVDSAVDARGAYRLQNVAPGRAYLSANVRGRGQISKTVDMPADSDLTVNLEFVPGARLTGRVSRGGKPLSGVPVSPRIVTTSTGQHVDIHEVRTSASGEYVIEDLPPGEYTLWVDSYRSPNVRISDDDKLFDIDVPYAQLAGRLLEQGGKVPVVGAVVDLWSAQPGAASIRLSARSDHFGQFAVRGLQPGDFVLSVYKPGYELYREPLAYGSPVSDRVISLRPATGVEVRVRDATSGKTVTTVSAMELINGQPGIVMRLHFDQNGIAYVPSAVAGSSLKFSAMGYAPATVTDWNGEGLEVSLQRQSNP